MTLLSGRDITISDNKSIFIIFINIGVLLKSVLTFWEIDMLTTESSNSRSDHQYFGILDEEGYLIDATDWSPGFTERRAEEASVNLNEKHWLLIELLRDKYLRLGALPPMRTVCKTVGIDKIEIKKQFGSCLNFWKMAGLPNPGEEAKSYMN